MFKASKLQKNKQENTEIDMAETSVDNTFTVVTLDEKIEKLRKLIEESTSCDTKIKYNQAEKAQKLQQKLRYLEYFKDYSVGTIIYPG